MLSILADDTTAIPEVVGNLIRGKFWLDPVIRLGGAGGSAPASRTGDADSNYASGANFSLKFMNIEPNRRLD